MKKIISGAIALAFLGVIGVVSFDTGEAQSAESIVKTRIEAMRGPVLKNFKTIKAFIKEGKGS